MAHIRGHTSTFGVQYRRLFHRQPETLKRLVYIRGMIVPEAVDGSSLNVQGMVEVCGALSLQEIQEPNDLPHTG